MISKASCSKTALPAAAAVVASTQLAPGFRFHPTDEELVSYYLKRKVTGRRIHVDAISEVDIYSSEPWDLPPQSRLRSRDLEWYFFTSLDRKYSNRCRTNRATAEGYWKTTGKDRPIQRRSRTIGMKKTLVYHSGRAPRGQRSNWVMHEYRLKDEDLTRTEIQQDGYVLCRIFQKSGPGPQNGAQYGAPFMEEEWEREEEEDANFVPMNVDGADGLMDSAGRHGYVQLGDFLQDPESGIQHLDAVPFGERSAEQDFSSHTEDSSIFVEGLFKVNDSVDEMPRNVDFTAMQDSETTMNGLEERNGLEDQSNCTSIMNNGYVQLKDIFGEETTNSASNVYSTDCPFKKCYNSLEDGVDQSSILPQNYVEGDSLNTNGVTSQLDRVQMSPAVQHDIYPETYDSAGNLPWEYPSSQLADDDLVYYDALSHEVPYLEDSFTYKTSLAPEFDFPEGLMEYYDAKNDNINYAPPDSFLPQASSQQVQSDAFPEIVRSRNSLSNEAFYAGENLARNASSGCPATGDGSSSGFSGVPANVKPKDCQDNTLTKRLASMLDSISAPPAFANEAASIGKTAEQIPATSRSVLHVSAGMIQIENVTTMGCPESWTLQKHSELRFLLSYGVYGNMVSKSISHEQRNKVLGGFLSIFCRCGFHLFFLSAFMLALSFKLVVYVYNM